MWAWLKSGRGLHIRIFTYPHGFWSLLATAVRVTEGLPYHQLHLFLCNQTPNIESLASEEYETNLFGPGFLKKASKRIELDETIAKDQTSNQALLLKGQVLQGQNLS